MPDLHGLLQGDGSSLRYPQVTTPAPVTPASVLRAAVGSEDDPQVQVAVSYHPQVRVEEGMLRGRQVSQVLEFWGVPFAAPPTGRLRFQPPAATIPWRGLREAGAPGPKCPQVGGRNL